MLGKRLQEGETIAAHKRQRKMKLIQALLPKKNTLCNSMLRY